jgi:predicted nuclease with TOPRIM domain
VPPRIHNGTTRQIPKIQELSSRISEQEQLRHKLRELIDRSNELIAEHDVVVKEYERTQQRLEELRKDGVGGPPTIRRRRKKDTQRLGAAHA